MEIPVLINEYLVPLHKKKKLKVFLCGRRPENKHFDLRLQLKKTLENKMGCIPFLGEDISELKKPKPSADALTIEVKEAQTSDLVIIFLGAPGTIAELTAFAMDKEINSKLVVFNDNLHKDSTSFINLGPLKLLNKDKIIYYNNQDYSMTKELVDHLDRIVAGMHFDHHPDFFRPDFGIIKFFLLSEIISRNPVRASELEACFPWSESLLRYSLKQLFNDGFVRKKTDCYIPAVPLLNLPLQNQILNNVLKIRMKLQSSRLKDMEKKKDYYLLLS